MAQNFLISSRHGTVYYYRRRVPNDLRETIGKPYLVKTLGTRSQKSAHSLTRNHDRCAAVNMGSP